MVAMRFVIGVLDIWIGRMVRGMVRDLVLGGKGRNGQQRKTENGKDERLHGPNVARGSAAEQRPKVTPINRPYQTGNRPANALRTFQIAPDAKPAPGVDWTYDDITGSFPVCQPQTLLF